MIPVANSLPQEAIRSPQGRSRAYVLACQEMFPDGKFPILTRFLTERAEKKKEEFKA